MQKERKQGETGRREEEEEEERKKGRGKDRRRGGRRREREVRSRRAASEGGGRGEEGGEGGRGGGGGGGEEGGRGRGGGEDTSRRLRVHQLEEQLELKAGHNQEVTRLQAQVTRLRSSVERGEAQGAELQYQLTLSQRDAAGLSAELQQEVQELQKALEDQHALQQEVQELQKALEDQHALQQEVKKLQKALDVTQHALQQEVQERDRLIDSFSSEKHRLLQLHQEALEDLQKKRDDEAETNRRQAGELKHLEEVSDQRIRFLEASVEAERASHLETKVTSEVIQLRGRDLEVALLVERSGLQEAQRGMQLLEERLRGSSGALQRLQKEYDQCQSDLGVALKTERTTTSDLSERLEDEKRRHANTHTLLEQEAQRLRDAEECLNHVRDTLQLHTSTGAGPAAKHAGKRSPAPDVLQLLETTLHAADKQVLDLLLASETLHHQNQDLTRLTSDQSRQLEESQQEVRRLHQERSDWSTMSRGLQAELERERQEREREKEEKEREKETEKEEREREKETEKEEREREVQKITDHHQKESKARLSFLYLLYQRLLAGCVLLDQPQSIVGDFTWTELCDVITEQLDRLTSDLRRADGKIAQLQRVCDKKSVCVRELQRSQECVLSRVEQSVRRREEAQSSRHTHTVTRLQRELQLSLSQGASLTSSLSLSREESSSLLSASSLLAGALRHAAVRLAALCQQKALLSRRLAEREALEEEVRRLAGALGGEEEEARRRGAARRRWRSGVCAVLALRRWSALTRRSTVLFRLEGGGAVCGGVATATEEGQEAMGSDKDDDEEDEEGCKGACARWLCSKVLSSIILSSMSDLQGALTHTGSSPSDVMSLARSALSRLLDRLLDQSDAAPHRLDEDTLSGRLRLGLRRTPPRPNTKALVSSLQQHFLVLSQRLHSAEVERRSLRLDVANQKRQEREDTCRTVPVQRFHSVCVELQQALSREQEAHPLVQDQTERLHALQRRVDAHADEHAATQRTLKHTSQALLEARQEVSRKERSLRVLGKHLSGVQRERRQLEERQQRMEDELRDAARRKDYLISNMKAAETSYKEVRESLVQSHRSLSAPPRPLPLPREHLELSGAESIMGAPEVAACQSLLSSVSQLCHTCSSRIGWLEQEVSASRGHVTALRGELQDACLRDNRAYVPLAGFPETFPFADVGAAQPVPVCDLSKEPSVRISPAPTRTSPAPQPAISKPLKSPKMRERKAPRKMRRKKIDL